MDMLVEVDLAAVAVVVVLVPQDLLLEMVVLVFKLLLVVPLQPHLLV